MFCKRMLCLLAMLALVVADIESNGTFHAPRRHGKDMLVKRTRDCGTFTMYCGGLPRPGGGDRGVPVPMACGNACFYINTFNPDFSTTFSSNVDKDQNRIQSGCEKKAGSSLGESVCNIAPFSQQFHDAFDDSTPASKNCDEFPMAEMAQDAFDPGRVPRNTLACIDAKQNSAAGAQLGAFIRGEGWYSQDESQNGGRKNSCKGPLQDGDTYKVAFNYDGDADFDKSEIPFCKNDDGELLKPSNNYDKGRQFYMTQLGSTTGKIDFPYQYADDNRYADGLSNRDLQQCSLTLRREGDATFEIGITYGNGAVTTAQSELQNDDDDFTVDPPKGSGYEPLVVKRLHPIGTGDGNPTQFTYSPDAKSIIGISWFSNTVGYDDTMNTKRPEGVVDYPGRYCYWTQVSDQVQSIMCYFPCNKPS